MAEYYADEKAAKVHKDLQECIIYYSKWVTEARLDYDYYLTKQWTDEDINTLDWEGRPHLSFNRIKPVVRLLSGIERQGRINISYKPVQSTDQTIAEIYNFVASIAMDKNDGYFECSQAFLDGVICGRGYLYIGVDFSRNLLKGEIKVFSLDPFHVYVDPASRRYDLSDAKYIMRVSWLRQEEIETLYPELKDTGINPVSVPGLVPGGQSSYYESSDGYEHRTSDSNLMRLMPVIEYWYREWESFDALIDKATGQVAYIAKEQKAQARIMVAESGGRIAWARRAVTRPVIKSCTIIGGQVMEETPSPLGDSDIYPIIPFFGELSPASDRAEYRVQGVVRALRDPQQEENKRRSQVLHIINTLAHSGWLGHEGSFVNKSNYKDYGSTPGAILEWTGENKPEQLTPKPIPNVFIALGQLNQEDVKSISGINSDLQGMYDKAAAGVAMKLRQQQGVMSAQGLFDNYRKTRKMLGHALIRAIDTAYPDEEIIRMIAGNDTFVDQPLEMLDAVLKARGEVELDIAVGDAPDSPTLRMQQFITLIELRAAGIPIPDSFLIEASDVPYKDKILQALAQAAAEAQMREDQETMMGAAKTEMMSAQAQKMRGGGSSLQRTANQDGAQQKRNSILKDLKTQLQ